VKARKMKKEQENQTENPITNWVVFPRSIASLYKNGEINRAEFFVYCYLRIQCNPYGICTTHMEAIRNDVFGKEGGKKSVSKNYVNKILLSLKSKRLLFYLDRTGRSGSFEVHFPDFIDPNKKITSIEHLFIKEASQLEVDTVGDKKSEDSTEVEAKNQKLVVPDNLDLAIKQGTNDSGEFRGYNNDTDNQKKIENTDLSVSYKVGSKDRERTDTDYVCKNPTDSFIPTLYEEETAKSIAESVGEKCMDRYLGLIKKGYFWVLEKAYGEYSEDVGKGNKIDVPAAYINGIIIRILKERIGK